MQLRTEQTADDMATDAVYAAMETGNTGRARGLMDILKETNEELYKSLRSSIIKEYGVSL